MQVQTSTKAEYLTIQDVLLESGERLQGVRLAYTVTGHLNVDRSNVIWVCHALTGNANPMDWWADLFDREGPFSPDQYAIVCVNVLGSCYGTSPVPKKVTVRDMVWGLDQVRQQLGIERIHLGIGGSLGGQQLLTWAAQQPDLFDFLVPLATNRRHSAWGIAFNEVQRMALELSGAQGLAVARAVAMLSYKSYAYFETNQPGRWEHGTYHAQSYMRHQGEEFRRRFNKESYNRLSEAMDSHDVSVADLSQVSARVLLIGIASDQLFPVHEQDELAKILPNGMLEVIFSDHGHDGFLTETTKIKDLVSHWLQYI